MKPLLLAIAVMVIAGCAAKFPIGRGMSVTGIKIEPCKVKSIYHPQRYV